MFNIINFILKLNFTLINPVFKLCHICLTLYNNINVFINSGTQYLSKVF